MKIRKTHTLVDSNYNEFSLTMAAKITGITRQTILNYMVRHDVTTIKGVVDRINLPRAKVYKTKFGVLTARQIHSKHPFKHNVSIDLVSTRLFNNGGMSEKIWKDIRKTGPVKPPHKKRPPPPKKRPPPPKKLSPDEPGGRVTKWFDRNKFCRGKTFQETCIHLDKCGDIRAFTKKHSCKFRADRSCFTAE